MGVSNVSAAVAGVGQGRVRVASVDEREKGAHEFRSIPLDRIQPAVRQVRQWLDPNSEAIRELAASVESHGLLHPISVFAEHSFFRIIAGERRFHAARIAGLKEIPCVVHSPPESAAELWEMQLIENIQREDLSAIEEGSAYLELNEKCGLTLEMIGARVGKSKSRVSRAISIAKLPEDIRAAVATSQQEGRGAIPFEHLSEVAKVDHPDEQRRLFQHIVEFRPTVKELRAERHETPTGQPALNSGWASTRFQDPEGQFWAVIHFRDKKHVSPQDIERAALKMLEDARRAQARATRVG